MLSPTSVPGRGRMNGIETIRWILYADDAVLFCKTPEEAQKILSIINDTCKRFGLTLSFDKTKTQVFNNKVLADQETLFSIDGEVIENVKAFTYLGQVVTTIDNKDFTEYRISRANSKFNELRNALCDYNINLYTRKKLLEACVLSRLTYGLQACYPNEAQMKKLEACWSKMLRSMIRGGWRRIAPENEDIEQFRFFFMNERIETLMRTVPLRKYINGQYVKYIGHVCRLDNYCLAKKMMFAVPTQRYYRDPWAKISEMLDVSVNQTKRMTQSRSEFAGLIKQQLNPPRQRAR